MHRKLMILAPLRMNAREQVPLEMLLPRLAVWNPRACVCMPRKVFGGVEFIKAWWFKLVETIFVFVFFPKTECVSQAVVA